MSAWTEARTNGEREDLGRSRRLRRGLTVRQLEHLKMETMHFRIEAAYARAAYRSAKKAGER